MSKYKRPDAISVGQLMETLNNYPSHARVLIDDPDTGWWMRVVGIGWTNEDYVDGDEGVLLEIEEYSDFGMGNE